jgi:sterol desaturase/sphingolipid hydroxylase (fatty acid hydroxylase superfamily)
MLVIDLIHWCKLSLFYLYPGFDYIIMYMIGDVSKINTYSTFMFGSLIIQLCGLFTLITFYVINKLRLSPFEEYRIHSEDWLWFNNNEEIVEKILKLNKTSLLEHISDTIFVFIVLSLTISQDFTDNLFNKPFQPFYQRIFNIMAMLLIFETWIYWFHRSAHLIPELYKYHKVHHEYNQSNALTGFHGNAIDRIIAIVPPFLICISILDLHLYTVWMFYLINVLHTIIDHCGYDFPFNPFDFIPFGNHSKMHNLHHSKNIGNYGLFWPLWDNICETRIQ